jgi:predicted SnoaL-like aldol condensation-catalyzing enzyme
MSTPAQSLTNPEENQRLVVRWFDEVWNKARREAIAELFPETAVVHSGAVSYRGPAEFGKFYDTLRESFSNFSIQPVVTLAAADLVAIHWSADFVETSTGKRLHVTGTSICRCKDGQMVEAWENWDQASLAAQLAS